MDELALARVLHALEADPDPYMPVEKLWQVLHQEGLALDLDRQAFLAELESDARFELTQPPAFTQDEADLENPSDEVRQEMHTLGLYGGPRVKLASRKVSADDVLAGLVHNLNLVNQALLRAWDNRPRGDPEAEGMLMEAMAKAEKLGREIQEVITNRERRPPEEKTS